MHEIRCSSCRLRLWLGTGMNRDMPLPDECPHCHLSHPIDRVTWRAARMAVRHDAECRAVGAQLGMLVCGDARPDAIAAAFDAVGLGDVLQFNCAPDSANREAPRAFARRADAVGPAAPTAMILALPRSRAVSSTARDAVRRFADQLGAGRTADACLLVSELVTNAYVHGAGQIRLAITLHDQVARFDVHDEGDATVQSAAQPGEHGGWGVNIVGRVADRWGAAAAPTHVWFELHALTPSQPTPHPAPPRIAGPKTQPHDAPARHRSPIPVTHGDQAAPAASGYAR